MIFRLTILLLAFGIVLQGCTLQKRSLMPGWHVEKLGQASAASGTHIAEPVAEIFTEESLQTVVVAPSFVDPLIPVKALMAFSSQVENARVLKLPRHVPRANWHEPQPIDEVVPSAGVKLTNQSSIEDDSKQKRIALGLLGALLVWASAGAFFLAALDMQSLWALLLVGVGLLALALRALSVAFPRLRAPFKKFRALFKKQNKPDAGSRKKREARTTDQSNRDWLWLLALIPVALIIAVVSTFSFGGFGM
ncbi:MAG: hypothetical protein CMD33_00235 [Flavobacteriales bacterium]|nr:hypothetical protein [Flavobacteriales bacterium]